MLEEDRRLDQLSRRSSSAPRYPNAPSASLNRNFPPPIIRFAGDGLDFRRPVMSTTTTTTESERHVIDLTLEEPDQPSRPRPRPPVSFAPAPGHEVILLDDDEDDQRGDSAFDMTESDNEVFDTMPDVEVLYSRPRSVIPQSFAEYARDARRENSVQTLNNSRPEPQSPSPRRARISPPTAQSGQTSSGYFAGLFQAGGHLPRLLNQRRAGLPLQLGFGLRRDTDNLQPLPAFNQPDLNFETVGFDMGRHNVPAAPRPRPIYEAPSAPPEGFIRTPAEEDTVICPNCDCELGQGDDETKRQIWVIRSCGHVSNA